MLDGRRSRGSPVSEKRGGDKGGQVGQRVSIVWLADGDGLGAAWEGILSSPSSDRPGPAASLPHQPCGSAST